MTPKGRPTSMIGHASAGVGGVNGRLILAALRRSGAASKAELARTIGLTNNAAGMIVAKLIAAGLILEVGKRYGGRGQPATLLRLEPTGAYAIGARLERHRAVACLIDFEGSLIDRVESEPIAMDDVARLRAGVSRLLEPLLQGVAPESLSRLVGVGVAREAAAAMPITELPGDGATPPMLIETIGNAAAAGELVIGRGHRREDFLSLFIGPALSGAVVMNGDFRRGSTGHAGDWGAMPAGAGDARLDGPATDLMARASLQALARRYGERLGRTVAIDDLDAAIAADDATFAAWMADAAAALAGPLLTAVRLLDIQRLVLDGDLAPPLMTRLIAAVIAAMGGLSRGVASTALIDAGAFGPRAVEIGAACLPLHIAFGPARETAVADPDPIAPPVVKPGKPIRPRAAEAVAR